MNAYVTGLCVVIVISLGLILRSETAGPYGMNVFSSVRTCQAIFRAAPFASLTVTYSHPGYWPSLGSFRLAPLELMDLKKCPWLECAFPSRPEVAVLSPVVLMKRWVMDVEWGICPCI